MEDKKISEAVELLYKGGKMLSYHCPECNLPLFKYEEKIICPSCNVEYDELLEEKEVEEEKAKEVEVVEVKHDKLTPTSIEKNILILIEKLTIKAHNSESIAEINELLETINKALNILEKIRKIN